MLLRSLVVYSVSLSVGSVTCLVSLAYFCWLVGCLFGLYVGMLVGWLGNRLLGWLVG